MAGHVDGVAVAVKAAHARADQDTAPHAAEAADHVHDARAGKVDVARVEEVGEAVPAVAHPAVLGPGPVDDDGVDPGGDEEGVACRKEGKG